jgi:hypothetical protein
MAKLIGHYYNISGKKAGGFTAFEVDRLQETEKQYKKTTETIDGSPAGSYDYWVVLYKSDLGRMRIPSTGCFLMFALREDMPLFKAMVVERLEQSAEKAKLRYESALAAAEAARRSGEEEIGGCTAGQPAQGQNPGLTAAAPGNGRDGKPSVLGKIRTARRDKER